MGAWIHAAWRRPWGAWMLVAWRWIHGCMLQHRGVSIPLAPSQLQPAHGQPLGVYWRGRHVISRELPAVVVWGVV